jgi:hypothetical protein
VVIVIVTLYGIVIVDLSLTHPRGILRGPHEVTQIIPVINPVVRAEPIQIQPTFFLNGVLVDELPEGGTVISMARYCTASGLRGSRLRLRWPP